MAARHSRLVTKPIYSLGEYIFTAYFSLKVLQFKNPNFAGCGLISLWASGSFIYSDAPWLMRNTCPSG